jgi:hypothetical protein
MTPAINDPKQVIEVYHQRVSSFPDEIHSLRSEKGAELEEMLYEIFDFQKKYSADKEISKACDNLSASIINKLEGLV